VTSRDSGGQVHRQQRRQEDTSTEEVEAADVAAEVADDVRERQDKIEDDVDAILDDIDDVLEENAEDFVRSFVQKGGE
jgi:ubiquitin-like protein Pup